MKVRSTDCLIDFLAERKQIRKRELISIKNDLGKPNVEPKQQNKRTSILLGYAHWEGFVKEAARAYVDFVTQKSRGFSSLSHNFKALACRQELQVAHSATKKIKPHLDLVRLLTEEQNRSITITAATAIDTESNLDESVFLNICDSIGIDFAGKWATQGPFMNDLFVNRCKIAHGEIWIPKRAYAVEVLEAVIKWIQDFSADIENAAVTSAYLAPMNASQQCHSPVPPP